MSADGKSERISPISVIGLSVYGLLAVPYLLSGLFVPLWMTLVLWTIWAAILTVALTQRRRRPVIVAALPAIALGVWLVGVSIGAA